MFAVGVAGVSSDALAFGVQPVAWEACCAQSVTLVELLAKWIGGRAFPVVANEIFAGTDFTGAVFIIVLAVGILDVYLAVAFGIEHIPGIAIGTRSSLNI